MWNELYIYTMIAESQRYGGAIPGYWSNMHLYRINAKINFLETTNLMLGYNLMRAVEPTSGLSTAIFSNSGKDRGQLFQAMLNHQFSKKIDGYLLWEYFLPGDFYNAQTRNATFFRWQFQVKL